MTIPFDALSAPLLPAQRDAVGRQLAALGRWQCDLAAWPILDLAIPATPIVSLYVEGVLRGCWASEEACLEQRLARAFLAAHADVRFGGIRTDERDRIVSLVSFPARARQISVEHAASEFSAGVHGLWLALSQTEPVLLVPDVARQLALDEEGFLRALEQKAGASRRAWPSDGLFAFETERVVARVGETSAPRAQPLTAAVAWLARLVDVEGGLAFGLDPSVGVRDSRGYFRHARAAVVVQALGLDAVGHAAQARARRWLSHEFEQVLRGHLPEDWPHAPAEVAGTLALAALAGFQVDTLLQRVANDAELLQHPWHAAQVVAALGERAPSAVWQACVSSLESEAYAPWVAIAAHRRGDQLTFERAVRGLVDNLPGHGAPSSEAFVTEPALAALTIEALALAPDQRGVTLAALELLKATQLFADTEPVTQGAWVDGAFPLSRASSYLRSDVTAHAALALATATTA